MRHRLLLVACVYLTTSTFSGTSASAHTSVGGGGSDDPNADCLRWEAVPIAPADAAAKDGSADGSAHADGGGNDAGASGATVLRCV